MERTIEAFGHYSPNHNAVVTHATAVNSALSAAQLRVLKILASGAIARPANGSALVAEGTRICTLHTMNVLLRNGLANKDARGCWSITPEGKAYSETYELR